MWFAFAIPLAVAGGIGLIGGFMHFVVMPLVDRFERKMILRQPFGAQRLEILDSIQKLCQVRDKYGDPSDRVQLAIHECRRDLNKIDQAVALVHEQDPIANAQSHRVLADLILKTCQEDLDRFRPRYTTPHRITATVQVVQGQVSVPQRS